MAYIGSRYYILRVGASMGLRYGPVVVGNTAKPELIAVPGTYTTATLLVRLQCPMLRPWKYPLTRLWMP